MGAADASVDTCCLCGNDEDVKHCPACRHDFCNLCRELYFYRGYEALKQFLTRKPPRHCRGHEDDDDQADGKK